MTIEQRVETLEKTNRRYRAMLSAVILLASALALMGFLKTSPAGPVVTSSVKVVDSKGVAVIEMTPMADGGGRISIRNNCAECGVHFIRDDKRTCRANQQTMANAIQAFRVKNRLSAEALMERGVRFEDLEEDLQTQPICPNGGAYTFVRGTGFIRICCSIPAHGWFEPGLSGG